MTDQSKFPDAASVSDKRRQAMLRNSDMTADSGTFISKANVSGVCRSVLDGFQPLRVRSIRFQSSVQNDSYDNPADDNVNAGRYNVPPRTVGTTIVHGSHSIFL